MPAGPLLTTLNWALTIPDIDTVGYFEHCAGLEVSVEVFEYREGGNNDFVHHLPGCVRYPNLVLSRGVTNQDALLKWFQATQTKAELKEITITLKANATDRTWTFADAFPVRWTGPVFHAGDHSVATESLEIAHSGLKPV